MQKPFYIQKIAVLGAGVMGAQIAAQCVNAGIETYLFDLPGKQEDKTKPIANAIAKLKQLKPNPLGSANISLLLHACNYDEHMDQLTSCDLIIEAIAERLDWKEELYQRVIPYLNDKAILVTNTSGLSIHALKEKLPLFLQHRFCGVHFFNPPRYMHLAELIPTEKTDPVLLNNLETWLTTRLGKGVVRAKDTPNFIANRVGVFALLTSLHWADIFKLKLDEVDALTGVLVGRPKSATCRTMDVVGLDTMQHVVNTMQQQLKADPWHALFQLPNWLVSLIETGHLGQKTGQGIYRKRGQLIEVYDVDTNQYQPSQGMVSDEVKAIMAIKDPVEQMMRLMQASHPQAKFLSACFSDLFLYCAYHLKDIAHSVKEVDLAMRWGFGWQYGPFETWQLSGFMPIKKQIEQTLAKNDTMCIQLPYWLNEIDSFYKDGEAFSPSSSAFVKPSVLPVYQRQMIKEDVVFDPGLQKKVIFENEGVVLWSLVDDIGVVEFKTKANSIGQVVVDGLNQILDIAHQQCSGLIIHQKDPSNFSAGANLKEVANYIETNQFFAIERLITAFQTLAMRIKYSVIPIVAALRGKALGGGLELVLHCSKTMAAFESYPGLVELGVGLIPAGGGCKEMAMRAFAKSPANIMLQLTPYYEQIAKAQVAESALDAKLRGYLRESDGIMMHQNEVLFAAMKTLKAMLATNYQPPIPHRFQVAGIEGRAQLEVGLVNWLEGGYISDHDYLLASKLASVMCGGDVNQGEWVSEEWILALEKEAFMSLVIHERTKARIQSLLETGRPLRN